MEQYGHCRGLCHQDTLSLLRSSPELDWVTGSAYAAWLLESRLHGVDAVALFRSKSGICKRMVVALQSPGKDLG